MKVRNWIKFSFKVYAALLTAQIIVSVTVGGAVLLVVALVALLSSASAAPVAPAPTKIYVPSLTTPLPVPSYLTVARIEQEREALTDLQQVQYDQSILGEVIQFHGQVTEVSEDGSVLIDEGGFFTIVTLLDIPADVTITWHKGHLVEGMGTVADVDTFLGLMIEIQVTSWNN